MAITITVPADTKTPGTAGHTSDHNLMSDALTTLGASAANTAGDTFTGLLTAGAGAKVNNISTPSTPTGGAVFYGVSGRAKFVGSDGNRYHTGRAQLDLSSTMTVSVDSFNVITDGSTSFQYTVEAAKYRFRARIVYLPSGTVGGPTFNLTSPAFTVGMAIFTCQFNGIASGFARRDAASGFGTSLAAPANATVTASNYCSVDIEGLVTFTASGTLAVNVNRNAGSNIVIQAASFFELFANS